MIDMIYIDIYDKYNVYHSCDKHNIYIYIVFCKVFL